MGALKRKIVYILGMGHSGSTVLNMILTSTGKAVGLGEVCRVLSENLSITKDRICSCGKSALDCEFWGPIVTRLASLPQGVPLSERYQLVLERAKQLYGPELTIVDSSKVTKYVRALASDTGTTSRMCALLRYRSSTTRFAKLGDARRLSRFS
jgi:hypothetical protein